MKINPVWARRRVFISMAVTAIGIAGASPTTLAEDTLNPPNVSHLFEYIDDGGKIFVPVHPLASGDECCTKPGQAEECWVKDAQDDGAWCNSDDDCLSNSCNTDKNLCTCTDDGDCNDGGDYQGICDTGTGLCGPSYCNGIRVCSCWGGCVRQDLSPYEDPTEMCADIGAGYAGVCCEGSYPAASDVESLGFCSNDPSCGDACTADSQCDDNNPCTKDTCRTGICVNLNEDNGIDCSGYYNPPGNRSADCNSWTCQEGICTINSINDGMACLDKPLAPAGDWHEDCYSHKCSGGRCSAASKPAGTVCDDDNECSTSACDADSACVGIPLVAPMGDCCDSANTATYSDGNDCTVDSCDGTFHDLHLDAVEGTPCPNNQDHPDDACGIWACGGGVSSGTCVETRYPNDPCDDSVPNGMGGANHDCGEWTCDPDGGCTEKNASLVGTSCTGAHGDDACGMWLCGDGADLGNCVETVYEGIPCDAASGGPGGNNTDCSYWTCQADASCTAGYWAAGTPCAGDHADDVCGTWSCDGGGSCEETAQVGAACDAAQPPPANIGGANGYCYSWICGADASCAQEFDEGKACDSGSGGPGGANDFCGTWACSALGICEETTAPDGTVCDWAADGDSCGEMQCLSGDCQAYTKSVGDSCEPTGVEDPCSAYTCDVTRVCSSSGDQFNPGMSGSLESCPGGLGGELSTGTPSASISGDNACADDDYAVDISGRFSNCNQSDFADAAYSFDQVTAADYQLRHTMISVDVQDSGGYSNVEDWDPLIYTHSLCGDGTSQFTCNDNCDFDGTNLATNRCTNLGLTGGEPAVTAGPWPLRDFPTTADATGYVTTDTYTTSVVVDSKACLTDPPCPTGGEFELNLSLENHENDDCRNTASYVAAPIIDGGTYWKERWRGNTNGFTNFFDSYGLSGPSCWNGAASTATDPKAAFFRVELPDGITSMPGEIDWDHSYKIYTDHAGIGTMSSILAFWGPGNLADGSTQCESAITSEDLCLGGGEYLPRERIIQAGDSWRNGYLTVSNRDTGVSGNYEVNIVRVPRPFVSMAKIYVGDPVGTQMDLEGYRLDFVPTNDQVYGYAVIAASPASSSLDNGWLVDPQNSTGKISHAVVCSGLGCYGDLNGVPQRSVGFHVPLAGDFYGYYCINAAGYVSLRQESNDTCASLDTIPTIEKLTVPHTDLGASGLPGRGPVLAPLWGDLIPCYGATVGPCVHQPAGVCELYAWDEGACTGGLDGEIISQLAVFEGTLARIISWDGFQSRIEPSVALPRDNSLQFQVIIRIDGRITYFFRAPTVPSTYDSILNYTAWITGLTGTRSQSCSDDADCDSMGGVGLYCDVNDYDADGFSVYSASDYCVNRVYDYTDTGEVGGSWQGGP